MEGVERLVLLATVAATTARPKSDSLAVPFWSKSTFALLTSQWMIRCMCRNSRPYEGRTKKDAARTDTAHATAQAGRTNGRAIGPHPTTATSVKVPKCSFSYQIVALTWYIYCSFLKSLYDDILSATLLSTYSVYLRLQTTTNGSKRHKTVLHKPSTVHVHDLAATTECAYMAISTPPTTTAVVSCWAR